MLFDAVDATIDSAALMAGVWRTLRFDAGRFELELEGDFSLATELADHLVRQGVDFRTAHGVAARIVRHCEAEGGDLSLLTPDIAAGFHPALGGDLSKLLNPRGAAERRACIGGSAPQRIAEQVQALRRTLLPTSASL